MKRICALVLLLLCVCSCIQPLAAFGSDIDDSVFTECGFQQMNLPIGSSVTLETPPLTTDVSWRSSAPSVISVSSTGVATAVGPGVSVIYAVSSRSGEIYTSWIINAAADVEYGCLAMNRTIQALEAGDTLALSATAQGDADGSSITWFSSDENVATVVDGTVTAVSDGMAVIYATSGDGLYTSSCVLYVAGSTLELPTSSYTLPQGKTLYNYNKKTLPTTTVWASSDPSVAIVRMGFIEALKPGKAVITAITEDGDIARCNITVTAPEAVTAAYMEPNNPHMGVASDLVLIANPAYDTLYVKLVDANGNVVDTLTVSKENAAYTTKTVKSRTVNIWRVPVTFEEAGSYKVQCGSANATTYEFLTYVIDPDAVTDTANLYLTTANLNMRSKASTSGTIYKTIPINTTLTVTETVTNASTGMVWGCVSYGGYTGYVSMDYMSPIGNVNIWYPSTDLLNFVSHYEGYRSVVYYDIGYIPTIGYGNTIQAGNAFYNYQTKEECWADLSNSMNRVYGQKVNNFAVKNGVLLTQSQFDALTSFTYNMGQYCWSHYSFKLRTLMLETPNASEIDPTELRYAFGKQSRSSGSFILGLFRRRMDEWEMFVYGDYDHMDLKDLTGDLAFPSVEDQTDPDKYGSDWTYIGE